MELEIDIARSKRGTTIYRRHQRWVFRSMVRGRQYYFPLGFLKTEALALADEIKQFLVTNSIEAALLRYNPHKVVRDTPAVPVAPDKKVPTVGELLDLFLANVGALDISEASATQYKSGILGLSKLILNDPTADRRNLSTSALTPAAWDRIRSDVMARCGSEDEKLTCKITLNSKLRSVRAMIRPTTLRTFQQQKPDWDFSALKTFYSEAAVFKKAVKKYRLPPNQTIHEAFKRIAELADTDPAACVVGLLAVYAGMRAEEIAECCWAWFDERPNWNRIHIVIDKEFKPKGTQGNTEIHPAVTAQIKALLPKGKTDYLLGDTKRERDEVIDRARAAMASVWGEKKQLHELRKLFGSYIASTRGLYVAQKLLRHESAETTSQSYADVVVDAELRSYWEPSTPTAPAQAPSTSLPAQGELVVASSD
jgi:integrase